jgi:hypothetical protein
MTAMKLYRLLQAHLSAINSIVQGLHNETMTLEDAKAKAAEELDKVLTAIRTK